MFPKNNKKFPKKMPSKNTFFLDTLLIQRVYRKLRNQSNSAPNRTSIRAFYKRESSQRKIFWTKRKKPFLENPTNEKLPGGTHENSNFPSSPDVVTHTKLYFSGADGLLSPSNCFLQPLTLKKQKLNEIFQKTLKNKFLHQKSTFLLNINKFQPMKLAGLDYEQTPG